MTIGKKIKYIRKLYHMSSAELAQRSGIHPVSIRKYETDKMVPQQAQINRIAGVFNLSPAIFSGISEPIFDFQYSGDLLMLLIMLYTSGGLTVTGDRSENGALIQDTVRFHLNPVFASFLRFYTEKEEIDPKNLSLGIIDDNTIKHFMYWEYMYNRKDEFYDAYLEEQTEERLAAYNQQLNDYEEVEIMASLSGRLRDIFEYRMHQDRNNLNSDK